MNDALQFVTGYLRSAQGTAICVIYPNETNESNFVQHKCFNSENNNRVIRTFYRPLFCTPADNLPILADIQPAELRRMWVHCLSTPCHGPRISVSLSPQLFNKWQYTAPQIDTPICTHCTTATVLLTTTRPCGTLWGVHRWNAERLDDTSRLRIFIPDIDTHAYGIAFQWTVRVPHNRLQTTAHAYTNSLWPILRPVTVAHNNKPSTMPPMSNPSWLNPLFNIWLVASIYVYFSVLLITIHIFPQSRLWTRM